MITKNRIKAILLFFICFVSFSTFIISKAPLRFNDLGKCTEEEKHKFLIKSANNDTNSPIIMFINPDNNDTIITQNNYDILVNITDENPPLPGNVLIEISNSTISFFNASMERIEEDQWLFIWDNITVYPNEKSYTFQVKAKDSSSNENFGESSVVIVYVEIYSSGDIGIINVVIYIIVVSLLIAGILVYFNKKYAFLSSSRE